MNEIAYLAKKIGAYFILVSPTNLNPYWIIDIRKNGTGLKIESFRFETLEELVDETVTYLKLVGG